MNTVNDDFDEEAHDGEEFDVDLLEEELRQAASILDPVPAQLREMAVAAYALHDLDARIAELTFDSVVDAIPVRGAVDAPRMLTFRAGEVTVDVEVTGQELLGQVLPPQQALIEVLTGPQAAAPLVTDDMGRFTGDAPPVGPFALRLRAGGDVVVTEWLRV
ncbi:multidrug efflux pump subunit AcrA (membrane-fusion protein) [Streptomyces canus]|nr:multidrug efflux pump subunit AcrA (membrane-fusion protein) [Streptomyces canus]